MRRSDAEPRDNKPYRNTGTVSLVHQGKCHKKRLVGVAGFEPTTFCTPCRRATKLRHTPRDAYLTRDMLYVER